MTSPPRMTRDGSLGGGMLAADGGVDHVPRPGIAQPCPRATIPMVALSRGVLSQAMPARGNTPWGGDDPPDRPKGGGSTSGYATSPAKPWTKEGAGRVGVDQVGVSIRVLRVTDHPYRLLSPPCAPPPVCGGMWGPLRVTLR